MAPKKTLETGKLFFFFLIIVLGILFLGGALAGLLVGKLQQIPFWGWGIILLIFFFILRRK